MRRIALVLLMAFSALHIVAQEMKVLSFVRSETDMTATNNRILDVNDRVCALIKVETSESGISFTFGTSQIVKREEQNAEHPSEIWLYVPPGVTKVTIQKSGYPVIRDYPLSEMLQSGRTYIMKLTCDKVVSYVETSVSGQFVSFVVSPADAYLEFDDKPLQLKKGQASTANPVPFGVYSYKVEAENYHPENGKIDVNDPDNSIIVNVTLKPAYGSIEVSGESARGGTVYLDKKYVGTAPVSLEIVPSGKHTVKVAKDMYNPYEEVIDIKDGENTLVTPIMQPNFQNITFKADGNAEIWINGKLRGTGYVKDDFEAGTLFVECKKENHRTTSANYPSVAGALPTTITLASPIPIYGVLLVKSNPIGADVFVDGENKGKTPRQLAQTIIGEHVVRIENDGYVPYERNVVVKEGQSTQLEADLENMITKSNNNGHEYVDLGLPSGTMWATCNVGAKAPEEYGDYFAWGEIITKNSYLESNYNYKNNSTNLPANADAASANWGGGWRMPTRIEFEELINSCTWNWSTQNGINGYKVTGTNGNCIFIPVAGYRYGENLSDAGSCGHYWSSSIDMYQYKAPFLFIYSGKYVLNLNSHWFGFTIRPICNHR